MKINPNLTAQALTKLFCGVAALAAMLFLPAGSLLFWQGWLLLGVLFAPMLFVGLMLLKKNPELLRKRLDAKEKTGTQKTVVLLSGMIFMAAFLLAGFGWRFGWMLLPKWSSWAAAFVFLLGYGLYGIVLRQNTYLSRTIEVQQEQRVIDTGLYSVVRHPMYASTVVMFLSMPLVLGSLPGFCAMLFYLPVIGVRMAHEERFLAAELPGYGGYIRRVRWKMIPFVW